MNKFLSVGILGFLLGLMLAPRKGSETRSAIEDGLRDLIGRDHSNLSTNNASHAIDVMDKAE